MSERTYSEGYLEAVSDILAEAVRAAEAYNVKIRAEGTETRDGYTILTNWINTTVALGDLCVQSMED